MSGLTFEDIAELPFTPKEPPEGQVQCETCDGIGTVPIRKQNPDWDGKDNETFYIDERWPDHSHGSEVCPSCGGAGHLPAAQEG